MPLQATSGAASYDAFGGGGAAVEPNYIESVFSTWLYTGNGSTQTITNNINLSGSGGLTWIKSRSAATNHFLFDTTRGVLNEINSNTTDAQASLAASLTAFNTTGFSLGAAAGINVNAATYASWTFRKQSKFFDVVTYTGTGSNTTIAHNLGSVPACIMVKRTDTTGGWQVYHRSLANTQYMVLNTTAAVATGATRWNSTTPTSSVFSLGTDATVNASGGTYVAYIFAHDAGGFGLTGTDNVISCGSYTGTGASGLNVTLGYEPQWILIKRATGTASPWYLIDSLRKATYSGAAVLQPNLSDAEIAENAVMVPNATGFSINDTSSIVNASASTYIYIAIRRGPMAVPTTGTSVFGISARTGTSANATVTGSAGVSDAVLIKNRGVVVESLLSSRLTGTGYLSTSANTVEIAAGTSMLQANPWDVMDGVKVGSVSSISNASGNTFINYLFDRAPSFFDEVCYTGTGNNTTITHNLGVVPELIIVKRRDTAGAWDSYCSALANTEYIVLNTTAAKATGATRWNSTTPTSSVFSVGTSITTNASAGTYVAYLFATCAGVSKVGSYTGTATTKQIDCGFTAGARFVLIKRTDSTGDWYYWDTARGIIAGNDSYLLLNSTAAQVTNTDYIDTYSAGFEISSTAPAAINASGGTFLFLAIA